MRTNVVINDPRFNEEVQHLEKNESLIFTDSVCSTEPEEGEQVVREFLKTSTDFRIIEEVESGFLHPFIEKGVFRIYPHKHNMNGFLGATLCRNR